MLHFSHHTRDVPTKRRLIRFTVNISATAKTVKIKSDYPIDQSLPYLYAKFNNKSSAVAEMDDRFTTIHMGRKVGAAVPLSVTVAGSPSNTMSPGPRPTSTPSGILIHPTVLPQYTNVTDRQTGQTDNGHRIGRTVLQTVAQKRVKRTYLKPWFHVKIKLF